VNPEMMSPMNDRNPAVSSDGPQDFTWDGFEGRLAPELALPGIRDELLKILDPAHATRTIHWGRNYLYEARLRVGETTIPVVVKQFRNHGFRKALERRFRGSKAQRSWKAAWALEHAGLSTPRPLALVESTEKEGNSWFITALVDPGWEVRFFFRRLNGSADTTGFPELDSGIFLRRLGRLARKMHDAGLLHRDFSMGNILAHPDGEDGLDLYIVDTNRMRVGVSPGLWRRTRDICRLPVLRGEDRQAFLEGYWGKAPGRRHPRWWIFTASVRGYILKHQVKNFLRRRKARAAVPRGGKHHAHIPPAEKGAPAREKIVWDYLSDQPHQHAGKWEKMRIRLADAPEHLGDFLRVIRAAPRVYRRFLELRKTGDQFPVIFDGFGLAVRPMPEIAEAHLRAILGLGVRKVLIRLHPWDEHHEDELHLARSLKSEGLDLAFSLPQNRELVKDRGRWTAAVERLAETFAPLGTYFQIGQAINRSKWGIWTPSEYVALAEEAAAILGKYPGVSIMGPSVIDFEFQATVARLFGKGPAFDVLASLLYVDRRGAPENSQMGLDTRGKITLLKAIADIAPGCRGRSWITEVNWPLWEGPYSPAGRSVSVDEETQADYLVRYFILGLGTGFAERIYWWRLAARGYGLADPEDSGSLRLRPSYQAMKTMIEILYSSSLTAVLPSPEHVFLYLFSAAGRDVVVGWSGTEEVGDIDLPRVAGVVLSRDGKELPSNGVRVTLTSSPRYFFLENGTS